MKKIILLLLLFVLSCLQEKNPITYSLTTSTNISFGGAVSPPTQQYEEGTIVTITATPTNKYKFLSWSGSKGSKNTTSVVMNSDKKVTANFVKKKTCTYY